MSLFLYAKRNGLCYFVRMKSMRANEYLVNLLKAGCHTFTSVDAEKALGKRGRALYMALRRLQLKHWLASPVDGFYVIIDPQHQGFGVLPPEWIIDDLAKFLGVSYYVSTLSAAMLHGSSHQKLQRFHVVASRQLRKIERGGYRIDFFCRNKIHSDVWGKMKSSAGYFHVSTPEMTAYDLLAYKSACPSLDQAATIYVEMGHKIQSDRLAGLIDLGWKISILQRVGWLLDFTGWQEKTRKLAARLASMPCQWKPLRTDHPAQGKRNDRWKIIENVKVEPDIERK